MPKIPLLGSESFWEMAALAMTGQLASCQSCVEYFYFQSQQNATAFLSSCARGGLLEEVSLLDLYGDVGPRLQSSLRQRRYDQPIYVSAPTFRKRFLDLARKRIENTKRSVYNAFRLYHEELGADDGAIDSAYLYAVQQGEKGMLRYFGIAKDREDVDLSPVAKLRLIDDGYRNSIRGQHQTMPRREVEKLAAERTAMYVRGFSGQEAERAQRSDRAVELETFIKEFLLNRKNLADFWPKRMDGKPNAYYALWMPVIGELVHTLYDNLILNSELARALQFIGRIQDNIHEALEGAGGETNVAALCELSDDLRNYVSEFRSVIPVDMVNPCQPGVDSFPS